MKKRLLALITAIITVFSLLAVTASADYVPVFDDAQERSAEDTTFEALNEDMLRAALSQSYILQHSSISDPESYAKIHGFELLPPSYFENHSRREMLDIYAEIYERLMKIDRSKLVDRNKYQYDFIKDYIETQEMLRDVDEDLFTAFDQNTSAYAIFELPLYVPFSSAEDADKALDVFETFGDYADMACEKELRRLDKGLVLTQTQLDMTIAICTAGRERAQGVLKENYARIVDNGILSAEKQQACVERMSNIVDRVIVPAFDQMLETLGTIKAANIEPKGLACYEGGEQYFKYLIKYYAGIKVDDMRALFDELYAIYLPIWERYTEIHDSPELLEQLNESYAEELDSLSSEEIVAFIIKAAEDHYPAPVSTDYEVIHMESYPDPSILGYYTLPKIGADSQTITLVDGNLAATPKSLGYTILAHEGIPGHMYHYNFMMYNGLDLQIFLATKSGYLLGFCEGWTTFVEQFIFDYLDMNDVQKDDYEGYASGYRRGSQSIADIYVNGLGHSYEEYLAFRATEPAGNLNNDERYMNALDMPTMYLDYFIGRNEMRKAFSRAEEALGDRFNEKDYYQFLLDVCLADYATLEQWENVWIEKTLAADAEIPDARPESDPEDNPVNTPGENPADNSSTVIIISLAAFAVIILAAGTVILLKKRRR